MYTSGRYSGSLVGLPINFVGQDPVLCFTEWKRRKINSAARREQVTAKHGYHKLVLDQSQCRAILYYYSADLGSGWRDRLCRRKLRLRGVSGDIWLPDLPRSSDPSYLSLALVIAGEFGHKLGLSANPARPFEHADGGIMGRDHRGIIFPAHIRKIVSQCQ